MSEREASESSLSEFGSDGSSISIATRILVSSGADYTASNSSAVVFKFGVRLDR